MKREDKVIIKNNQIYCYRCEQYFNSKLWAFEKKYPRKCPLCSSLYWKKPKKSKNKPNASKVSDCVFQTEIRGGLACISDFIPISRIEKCEKILNLLGIFENENFNVYKIMKYIKSGDSISKLKSAIKVKNIDEVKKLLK